MVGPRRSETEIQEVQSLPGEGEKSQCLMCLDLISARSYNWPWAWKTVVELLHLLAGGGQELEKNWCEGLEHWAEVSRA